MVGLINQANLISGPLLIFCLYPWKSVHRVNLGNALQDSLLWLVWTKKCSLSALLFYIRTRCSELTSSVFQTVASQYRCHMLLDRTCLCVVTCHLHMHSHAITRQSVPLFISSNLSGLDASWPLPKDLLTEENVWLWLYFFLILGSAFSHFSKEMCLLWVYLKNKIVHNYS